MKYLSKSFSVAGSAGSAATCAEVGHTVPDRHGKCLRCSAKVRHAVLEGVFSPADHVAVISSRGLPSATDTHGQPARSPHPDVCNRSCSAMGIDPVICADLGCQLLSPVA